MVMNHHDQELMDGCSISWSHPSARSHVCSHAARPVILDDCCLSLPAPSHPLSFLPIPEYSLVIPARCHYSPTYYRHSSYLTAIDFIVCRLPFRQDSLAHRAEICSCADYFVTFAVVVGRSGAHIRRTPTIAQKDSRDGRASKGGKFEETPRFSCASCRDLLLR